MSPVRNLLFAAVFAGCSAPSAPSAEAAPVAATSPPPAGARAFPSGATFADLVHALRDDPAEKPGRGCLLSATGPLSFEAPVVLGQPSIPEPPVDLDAALTAPRHGAVRLWGTWGDTEGGDLLELVALTPVSKAVRSATTAVLAVTDKGTYFLAVGMPSDGHVVAEADVDRIKREIVPKAGVWVITAEAGVPLEKLREPLAWIAETKGTVVLATSTVASLGSSRRISRYDAKVEAGAPGACDLAAMQKPGPQMGRLGDKQYWGVGAAFEAISRTCGAELGPGEGGAIHVLTRISASGTIEAACAETDDTALPALRACAMREVKAMKLDPPTTPGTVNFGTSLLFFGAPIAGLCR
ncbi:MAG: hypothetical protein Q8P18_30720 [Pseudomonadota bacterium]|nr:hypothetical protein [Pseudomonadota bacterium]